MCVQIGFGGSSWVGADLLGSIWGHPRPARAHLGSWVFWHVHRELCWHIVVAREWWGLPEPIGCGLAVMRQVVEIPTPFPWGVSKTNSLQ